MDIRFDQGRNSMKSRSDTLEILDYV